LPDETQCFLGWNFNDGLANSTLFCFPTTGEFEVIGDGGTETIITDDLKNTDMLVGISVNHGNTIITRLDGEQKSSFGFGAVLNSDSFLIGAEYDNGSIPSNFTDILVGELIIYKRELSVEEIVLVENYLSNKWRIALA